MNMKVTQFQFNFNFILFYSHTNNKYIGPVYIQVLVTNKFNKNNKNNSTNKVDRNKIQGVRKTLVLGLIHSSFPE